MKRANTTRRIGFLVFEGVTALDFVGPMEAFAAASAASGEGRSYELAVIGLTRKPVAAESGLISTPHHSLDSAPAFDTIVVPGGSGLRKPQINARIAAWLKRRVPTTRRIASVCTGIYGLAPTGLLDGRRVTTHWAFAADVSRKFPKLLVDANSLFLKDGKFYTSAGVTSGIDLSLALIEEDLGPSIALAAARELVVYLKRPGGQAQYSEPLQFQARAADRFADLAAWVPANLRRPLSVETLARRANLGVRHFSREFRRIFNMTPAQFIEHHRLDEARRRLVLPRANVASVAESVGFKSADAFRRAFERRFGVAPSSYRKQFGARPAAAAADR